MKILPARSDYPNNLKGVHREGPQPSKQVKQDAAERRRVSSELLDDPIYRVKLLRRLRQGTAGAIEVWLWRWKLGDPPRAEMATEEGDRARFHELRAEVRMLIRDRPEEYQELEDRILGELPAGDPVDADIVAQVEDPK